MVPFQNCVRQRRPVSKMATITKNRASILSQKVPKFERYKHNDEFLTYITGFFMNFELLPILTDYAN